MLRSFQLLLLGGALLAAATTQRAHATSEAWIDFDAIDSGKPASWPKINGPTTQSPTTKAPITQAPITQAPGTTTPVTQTPGMNAPTTQAPVTQAPITQAPVTQAPGTSAPVTQAPVTQAPVVTPSMAPHTTKQPSPTPAATKPGKQQQQHQQKPQETDSTTPQLHDSGAYLTLPKCTDKDATMLSVEGVRGVFCVVATGKDPLCSATHPHGACPGPQPNLLQGSHCSVVKSGAIGCRPKRPHSDKPSKCHT